VLTVSGFSRQQIVEHLGISSDKIVVTYQGIAPVFRKLALPRVAHILSLWGLEYRGYLLCLGGVDPRKNTGLMLRVYRRVREMVDIDVKMVIVGIQRADLARMTNRLEGTYSVGEVIVTGFVTDEELVALYNGAAVFVYPSLAEGFGLPVLEAMACGTPVVASRATSIPEIAGSAAVLKAPTSPEDLAMGIARLIVDEPLRSEYVKRGLQRVRHYSWDEVAARTLEALRSVSVRGGGK